MKPDQSRINLAELVAPPRPQRRRVSRRRQRSANQHEFSVKKQPDQLLRLDHRSPCNDAELWGYREAQTCHRSLQLKTQRHELRSPEINLPFGFHDFLGIPLGQRLPLLAETDEADRLGMVPEFLGSRFCLTSRYQFKGGGVFLWQRRALKAPPQQRVCSSWFSRAKCAHYHNGDDEQTVATTTKKRNKPRQKTKHRTKPTSQKQTLDSKHT